MLPSEILNLKRDTILEVALSHRVENVRVFGSVIHKADNSDSDLDLLVDPTAETTMFDIAKIQLELSTLLGIKVDVLTPRALPIKFRHIIIAEAVPL
jgi:predicted nucleotidyltransferase